MGLRFELVDSHHPDWRGMRFSTRERAERELACANPPGRFFIKDYRPGAPDDPAPVETIHPFGDGSAIIVTRS